MKRKRKTYWWMLGWDNHGHQCLHRRDTEDDYGDYENNKTKVVKDALRDATARINEYMNSIQRSMKEVALYKSWLENPSKIPVEVDDEEEDDW